MSGGFPCRNAARPSKPPIQPPFDRYYAKGSPAWKCRQAYAERSLEYCADLSVFLAEDARTGRKMYALAGDGTYARRTTRLKESGDDRWKTTAEKTGPDGYTKVGRR